MRIVMVYYSVTSSCRFGGAEQILVAAIKGNTFVRESDSAASDILIST
jgi:hypothetical protein